MGHPDSGDDRNVERLLSEIEPRAKLFPDRIGGDARFRELRSVCSKRGPLAVDPCWCRYCCVTYAARTPTSAAGGKPLAAAASNGASSRNSTGTRWSCRGHGEIDVISCRRYRDSPRGMGCNRCDRTLCAFYLMRFQLQPHGELDAPRISSYDTSAAAICKEHVERARTVRMNGVPANG
jgi:hypothetical protein